MERLRNLYKAVEKNDEDRLVAITVKELGDLVMAVEILREVTSDMAILKAQLVTDRGKNFMRRSDVTTSKELTEMITNSVAGLSPLGVGDIYAESERLRK